MVFYTTYIKDVIGNNYLGIQIDRGSISKFLSELEDELGPEFETYSKCQQDRDGGSYHITVINVMEYNSLSGNLGVSNFVSSLENVLKYPIDDLKMMGLGMAKRNDNASYFVVCKSDKLDSIRSKYSLPPQDFHITLGFKWKDVFGVRKNEVMNKKSKFIQALKNEFIRKENFNFIRQIENFNENPNNEIIPISLSDTFLKVLCGDIVMDIGLLDPQNKLYIFARYKKDSDLSRMPISEFLKFISNK